MGDHLSITGASFLKSERFYRDRYYRPNPDHTLFPLEALTYQNTFEHLRRKRKLEPWFWHPQLAFSENCCDPNTGSRKNIPLSIGSDRMWKLLPMNHVRANGMAPCHVSPTLPQSVVLKRHPWAMPSVAQSSPLLCHALSRLFLSSDILCADSQRKTSTWRSMLNFRPSTRIASL